MEVPLTSYADAEITYAETGATRDGSLPAGYRHLRYRTRLAAPSSGAEVMAAAAQALMSWRMHEEAGVRVRSSAPRAVRGATVVFRTGVGPLRMAAPCRVVWTIEEERRTGFGCGTLPGHPARGEEGFAVERDADGSVWFSMVSFSRPARWYSRLAGPLVPLYQQAYARMCGRALRRLIRK